MKIAVTSKGKDLDSEVDPRFGRAAYIIIVDPDTLDFETVDNSENVNAFKGAGIQAGVTVNKKGAKVLLTGFCGPNAFKTLDAAGIKVVADVKGTVREAVEAFKKGVFSFADVANTEARI
ncbi:MAG: NifB/NifX family molybdenum-iron cluster-binding protein [Deltaproteobacteria bacterium]|nr:NifB/NifX family molybdenum-iron cluster-binding protein [Deltaproteobacteria bacterium]